MFTTIDEVKEFTGYDVTQETVIMAQSIVEAYVGRDEVEVISGSDKALLAKATAYQAAYMSVNADTIFQQVQFKSITQFGQATVMRETGDAPFIAPLTVIACRGLSWKGSRVLKTGSIFYNGRLADGSWKTE